MAVIARTRVGACIARLAGCIVATVLLLPCAAAQAQPTLEAGLWKTEVLQFEPILLRIALTAPETEPLRLVPPYVGGVELMAWPVWVTVRRDGPELEDPGEVAALNTRGEQWTGWRNHTEPRYPWVVAPGELAFEWLDLLDYMDPLAPGVYTVSVEYDARASMLQRPLHPEDPVPERIWEGRLEADVGPLVVREPTGEDAEAAEVLRDAKESFGILRYTPDFRTHLTAEHPTSTYTLYARFWEIWRQAWCDSAPGGYWGGEPEAQQAADQFVADYPDFPLNYQLSTLVAWSQRQAWREDAPPPAERWRPILEAARATGDLSLVQYMELGLATAEYHYEEALKAKERQGTPP